MASVPVAMGAELFEFQPRRRVATVFGGGVPRHAFGAFARVCSALSTL